MRPRAKRRGLRAQRCSTRVMRSQPTDRRHDPNPQHKMMSAQPKRRRGRLRASKPRSTHRFPGAICCAVASSERAMSLEGELVVRLDWDGRRVNDVHIRSTSFAASRLLVGRTAGEARNIVPSLYNLCARAHAAAATVALAAAASESPAAVDVETPSIGVVLEAVVEHVRCLLIDWPRALGREPNASPVARARRQVEAMQRDVGAGRAVPAGRALESIVADCVYGMPIAQWLQIETVEALQVWLDVASVEPALGLAVLLREHTALGASDIPLMPTVGATTLQDPLAGALARMQSVPLVRTMLASFGNGVVARIVARLAELAILLQQLVETQAVHWP